MFFETAGECTELTRILGFEDHHLSAVRSKRDEGGTSVTLSFEHSLAYSYPIASKIAALLGTSGTRLLWVNEYGIWSSSENLHLYYRVRMSYGDHRSLQAAPGHRFLDFESADLISYLDLVIRFGWGAYLLTNVNEPYGFLSHDGWIKIGGLSGADGVVRELEESSLFCVI